MLFFIKEQMQIYRDTWRVSSLQKIARLSLYDIGFGVGIVGITAIALFFLRMILFELGTIMPTLLNVYASLQNTGTLPPMTPALASELESNTGAIRLFYGKSILLFIGILSFCIVNASFWKGKYWSVLMKTPFTKRTITFNIIWIGAWSCAALLSFFLLNIFVLPYVLLVGIFLFMYTTALFRICYHETETSISIIKKTFQCALQKQSLFSLLLICLTWYIVLNLLLLLFVFLPTVLNAVLGLIALLFLVGWSRILLFKTTLLQNPRQKNVLGEIQ